MVCRTELLEPEGPPEWLSQMCSAMAREVREALQPLTNSCSISTEVNFPSSGGRSGYEKDSLQLPTCYCCGQKGHVRRGCRNPPIVLSNQEMAMDLWCGAVRGSNTATAPPCFRHINWRHMSALLTWMAILALCCWALEVKWRQYQNSSTGNTFQINQCNP